LLINYRPDSSPALTRKTKRICNEKTLCLILKGTVLKVEGMMNVKYGNSTMKWFETTYKEKRGWISIYDTDQAK
jgi:hypothetical protein